MKHSASILLFTVLIPLLISGQSENSHKKYDRAVSFLWENVNNKKVFNLHIQPNWFPDSTGFWYEWHSLNHKKFQKISFPDYQKSDLFDHQKLASILSDSLCEKVEENNLPMSQVEYLNQNEIVFTARGKKYLLDLENYSIKQPRSKPEENKFEKLSPDKKWLAFSKDYNLYIKSTETDEIKQLSTSGSKNYEYASWYGWGDIIEGEGGERPRRFNVDWSKDSEWLYTNICDLRTAQKMYLLDWSQDSLYRPRLLSYYRGSPGDTTVVYMDPVFFHVKSGKEIKPALPRKTHFNVAFMEWLENPGKVFLLSASRGYQEISLYSFDLKNEKLHHIYKETSTTNIDNFEYRIADKSGQILFLSERSGWRQLYALDLKTFRVSAITDGEYYINSIDLVLEEENRILFSASGKEKNRNPYYRHLYSISFMGNNLKLLTPEDCHHRVNFSPDGKCFVDNYSTVNLETSTALRSSENGDIIDELGKADVSALENWVTPEIFEATARDGETIIYGALWKPTNFDPHKKYPIIDNSYTGPHTKEFPEEFRRGLSSGNQALAELGFIVMVVDGLGSAGRSKEFHDYSYKNLGGNLADHVVAIRQLANRYPWIDTGRVGIFGHSAGGYDAAHALLAYPDFYKVGVASSADHDHRMEKAWWPEMYMGWPVDSAYHQQSNITMAGNLKGKLLITHGGIDENVNPSATFKLAEALIKNDRPFEMLIFPSQHHGYREDHRNYFIKKRWNFFVEHLLDEEPVWDFKWENKAP
jgi:dipeptidyl-peptidase-4